MEKAFSTIKPGMRDHEIMALAQYTVQNLGSEQQLIMAGFRPHGNTMPYAETTLYAQGDKGRGPVHA